MNNNFNDLISSKDSKWIYVKESEIHNKGIFAIQNIPVGTKIIEYKGEVISKKVAEERIKRDLFNGTHYIFELNDEYDIDGLVNGTDAIYINHSCNPNCEIDIIDDKIFVIALKDIKTHEELSYDYCFDGDENTIKHICKCGSNDCRGYIVDSDDFNKIKHLLIKK